MPRMPNSLSLARRVLVPLALFAAAVWAGDEPTALLDGTVVGVVDGDTADVRLASGMIRVRLHAIDAPESGQPHGKAAKAALSELVFGKAVQVEPYEQDRYDRLVARLWLGEVDVNAAMVKQGHAWTYRRYGDDAAYCAFEETARDRRLGLWRLPVGDRAAPWEWRQRKTRGGAFTDYTHETVAACVAALGKR
jgi:endonuclease YncB( thermonuclease family)